MRCEASGRGGGIEINAGELFPDIEDARIAAYQNYLGGGLLGSIQANANFTPEEKDKTKFLELAEALKKYFHNLTNHEGDEWEEATFEENQNRPVSAY